MLRYGIAGLKFGIVHDSSSKFRRLKPFTFEYQGEPDIEISFQSSGYFDVKNNAVPNDDEIQISAEYAEDRTMLSVYLKKTRKTEYIIEAKNDWSDIKVLYREGMKAAEEAFCTFLGSFIISNIMIYHSGFVLHASSVIYKGKGIVFTAPSGTGKSTHAAIWEKYFKARILNDDSPAIRYENNQANIYGTPWSGSSNKALSASSQLSAIVILEQADQNSITELTNEKAIPLLLPRVFLPYQNKNLMDMALRNFENAVRTIPKYLLRCRPDRAAAELVYKCIM